MPPILARVMKAGIAHRPDGATNFHRHLNNGSKVPGFRFDGSGGSFQTASVDTFGWDKRSELRCNSSGSSARKRASAMIAKIPLPLSTHIARVFYP
jgi:hypothetical protein